MKTCKHCDSVIKKPTPRQTVCELCKKEQARQNSENYRLKMKRKSLKAFRAMQKKHRATITPE